MVDENNIINQPFSFTYGEEKITYERVPRSGEVNKILIKVHSDCRVVVHAPEIATDHDVLKAIKKRSRWVYQQLRDFRQQKELILPRRYISGESHYYLGKQYLLKVIENNDVPSVKLLRGKFEVYVSRKDAGHIKEVLDNWYKAKAKSVFLKRLDHVLDRALWVTEKPTFRVRKMQTQWGSCSPQGTIILNPYLVKAPTQCIDYVILHELCHLAEHNHSDRFYQLMNQVMPDWELRKKQLDNMAMKFFA